MEHLQLFIAFLGELLIFTLSHVQAEHLSIKIVEEPSNYGWNNAWQQNQQQQQDGAAQNNQLKMRVHPANVSGPAHFRSLAGQCFSTTHDVYDYKFCPFGNVTQHEQSLRWNPYNGVLGVWQEWEIQNYTFTAMLYRDGDSCGQKYRSAKITFACHNKNEVGSVSEPNTCQYELQFKTPLVCHPHAMLVYPSLTAEYRQAWDTLEGELLAEEITLQGYKKRLHTLLETAGLYLSKSSKQELTEKAQADVQQRIKAGEFTSLSQCKEEYMQLKSELDILKASLHTKDHLPGQSHSNATVNIPHTES